MAFEGRLEVGAVHARRQAERDVESKETEEVPMRFAGRRARPLVAEIAPVVESLPGTGRQGEPDVGLPTKVTVANEPGPSIQADVGDDA